MIIPSAVIRMKHFAIILGSLMALSNPAVSDTINITVPSAVADRIDVYRLECADEGGQIELDGDEISKLWTDEGEEAYIIHAAFTCSGHGHMWCGTMGCPTDFVISNKFYDANRILRAPPDRISKDDNGLVTYWTPEGIRLVIED